MPHTLYPWARSGSQPKLNFADNQGMIHFEMPVAIFDSVEDAKAISIATVIASDMLGTLRTVLAALLQHDTKQR